ncbi:PREDICTED: tissue alpha-L-fucosidase-like isoform X3 [Amphimedon queenslandica]|uniref:alpha-L-fucosidase n=1 Tax=Amphimedon queenslandica TaxID=400682 RepID=A0AAN0JIU3_AMPQE|nr:PREDICTED: tissue alpha-L-fucosidase-like isoform X3 [Amphimedon queenslandica]|eukprot:XP_019856940.1 PREDICTED: tissue alpha-L-fucosidase-like isoform X3 [Amphimedon queenslandica]
MASKTLLLAAVAVFSLSLPTAVSSLECSYVFPEFQNPRTCLEYDLTTLSTYGPYNITPNGPTGFRYLIKICDLASTDRPDACASKPLAPAYAYNVETDECYALGNLKYDFAYPLDPTNSRAGIRVTYTNGDGGNGVWPRAIIYDLYCDTSGTVKTPEFSYEYPVDTYRFTWRTHYACPLVQTGRTCSLPKFNKTWDSLRFRTAPSWYGKEKFGIFVCLGLYSVPAYLNEWYWERLMTGDPRYVEFHNKNYGCSGVQPKKFPCTGPPFTFQDFAPMLKMELFDPDHWASVIKNAGAKYIVFTTKHHSGWTNFPSPQHWNWNSMDVGPHLDITGNLTASLRKQGIYVGLYHSLREWYHPLYLEDQKNNCSTTSFVDEVLMPTLKDMTLKYKPDIIWADGPGDAPCTHDSVKYWKTPEFFSWLYNESPVKETVLTNTRWGSNAVGSFMEGHDRFTPYTLIKNKWETPYTIQKSSWGYDRVEDLSSFWNTTHCLYILVTTVSCNGNLLLNIGPMADGTIDPLFEEILLEMGQWLTVNGEAIYNSIPWTHQNDTPAEDIWYTASEDWQNVYAISFRAPTPGGELVLQQPKPSKQTTMTLLGADGITLDFTVDSDGGVHIHFPTNLPFAKLAGKGAWTIKMTNVT